MTIYKRTAKKPNEHDGENDERLGGRSPRTFISEIIPLLKGMSAESMSSAEGQGDNELAMAMIEIELAVTYDSSAVISIPIPPSADYLFVTFAWTFLPQFNISSSRQIYQHARRSAILNG